MQIPILIERVDGNGYRSRGGEPFDLSAQGATREEVLAALQKQLQERLKGGAEVISLDVAPEPHPLARFAGMFKDDPLFESWQRSIAKYRRDVDADLIVPLADNPLFDDWLAAVEEYRNSRDAEERAAEAG